MERVYLDLHEHHIDKMLLMRIFPVGRGTHNYDRDLAINREHYLRVIERLRGLEQRYLVPKLSLQCALRHLVTVAEKNPCDMVRESLGLTPRGTLLSCVWATDPSGNPLSEDFVLGNLANEHLSQIMQSPKAHAYRARLDQNFGHCKIFASLSSSNRDFASLFAKTDPLYAEKAPS
jgi:MoaA/NifB/PqqE/SkfB family radical SAM enzyme